MNYKVRRNRVGRWFGGRVRYVVLAAILALNVLSARGAISVVNAWRMGENDPGAVAGGVATNTLDPVGSRTLKISTNALYSSDVPTVASNQLGSALSIRFTATNSYALTNIVSTAVDNFGLELWVKPSNVVSNQTVIYNGHTGTSGWGITLSPTNYGALFGGKVAFGSALAQSNVWTHLALVRNAGTATFYVNGAPAGTSGTAPNPPAGNFAIGVTPQAATNASMVGLVDEVRLFTFAPGQFSTNDFLLNASSYAIGTTALIEGPGAGSDSVCLAANLGAAWTARTNAPWLHLNPGMSSGFGTTNIIFSFDANAGAARSGTLTIAGFTVTINQAGSNYVRASAGGVPLVRGMFPAGVAMDAAHNVYVSDYGSNRVTKFTRASGTLSSVFSTGVGNPRAIDVDGAGNLYVAYANSNAIVKWTASSGVISNLVAGLNFPHGVALDRATNVFVADTFNFQILKRTAMTGVLTTNVSGLNTPTSVAVDVAGNLYIAETNVVRKFSADGVLTTIASASFAQGVAVDGSGNVYFTSGGDGYLAKWSAVSGTVAILQTNLIAPFAAGVDSGGNVYACDTGHGLVNESVNAYVDPSPRFLGVTGGNDSLPPVFPATAHLTGALSPTNDQPWLSVTGVTNGVVSYAVAPNPGPGPRTGNLIVFGVSIAVSQPAPTYSLATSSLLVESKVGSNSVVLATTPPGALWSATTNAPWLHLSPANQSGAGSGNVVFSFDANPTGSSRSGTLTIAGQTLTVTQVASNLVAATNASVVIAMAPYIALAVAVDDAGNVYFSDYGDLGSATPVATVSRWNANDHSVTLLITNGVFDPEGLAVDHEGNVYIADYGINAVTKWTATNGAVTVLAGFIAPRDVATDDAGNVYVVEYGANAVKKWTASDGSISNVIVGLSGPLGVDVDHAGNVYVSDANNNIVRKWNAESGAVTTVMSGVTPRGVAVDNSGNVYMTDSTGRIKKLIAATGAIVTLPQSFYPPSIIVAVDGSQNLYAINYTLPVMAVLAGFADPSPKSESLTGGSDVLAAVAPATSTLLSLFQPFSDQSWLTINSFSNGVTGFSFTSTATNRTGAIGLLGMNVLVTQGGPSYFLGLSSLLVGPAAGGDSVMLSIIPNNNPWSASANAAWLHIASTNQSGFGGTNVVFSYDANTGPTRSGTLTIAGQTVTVTQAGSGYLATTAAPTIIPPPVFGNGFRSVGVDGAGNVYGGFYSSPGISKWNPVTGTVTTLGSMACYTLGVNLAGDIALVNFSSNSVDRWSAANVQTPLFSPAPNPGTAGIDGLGNVYVSVQQQSSILKWSPGNSNLTTVVSVGIGQPNKVVPAGAGNAVDLFIFETQNHVVRRWSAANGSIFSPVTGVSPNGGTVDGSGNIFIAESGGLRKWSAVTRSVTTVSVPGATSFYDVAVDLAGNIYISDFNSTSIKMQPRAFVDATPKSESLAPGTDTLPPVLPLNLKFVGSLFPTSNVPWITITGITNNVISFSFTTNNTGSTRSGNINVLGRLVPVTQFGAIFTIGTTSLLEGPVAGSDSVALGVAPETSAWTALANDPWLHLGPGMSNSVGSTNVVFTFDANPGPTRTGTLAVADRFVTVTQAGSAYAAAGAVTPVSSGLSTPRGVAADSAGNLYLADLGSNTIKKWTRSNNTVTTVVSSGLNNPYGLAVDGAGNIYIADFGNHAIKKWAAIGGSVTSLVSTGLNFPEGVAVDAAGNVYIADTYNHAIKKWTAASNTVTTLVSSGLNLPKGVAVDVAGNVYIADAANNAIKKWTAANSNVTTLVSSGLNHPEGVAVDGSGNVHIADSYNSAVKTWKAATGNVINSLSVGLSMPESVAVDVAGNVYVADSYNNAVAELPRAFLDPTTKVEGAGVGFDALPVVLPAELNLAAPLAPTSDQSWLIITGVNSGVVNYSFAANFGPTRTAHINLLGLSVPVVQGFYVAPPTLTGWHHLGNGVYQFIFTNSQGAPFSVVSSTNLELPLAQWPVIGAPTSIGPGVFQFTTPPMTNDPQRFFRVRSP